MAGQARSWVERLGLANIEFHHQSILDLRDQYGQFDYIICHGVFSAKVIASAVKAVAECMRGGLVINQVEGLTQFDVDTGCNQRIVQH